MILVAKTVGGLEEIDDEVRAAGGAPATLVPLDLRNFDAIDQMGASIFQRFGRLDVLVGNAGLLGSLSPVTLKKLRVVHLLAGQDKRRIASDYIW